MNEEIVINWGSIFTILLGIVIVSFVVLILYRQRKSKRIGDGKKTLILKSNKKTRIITKKQ